MSNDIKTLFRLNKSNIKLASEVAAKAYFKADDFSSFSTDLSKRLKYIKKTMYMTFSYSLRFGEVYATSQNFEGVVAWLPYNYTKVPIWQYIRFGMIPVLLGVEKKVRKQLLFFDKLAKEKHKQHANFPHLYLYNLAVDPDHQGKGWASILLNPKFAKADKQQLPCYLETHKRNVPLYEHFGFEVIEHFSVPEFDNDMWLMMRFNK
ncbi:MAG: N-acetyltransferase [Candidatus Lokiarchaeota archaeon]|nr:N-acetyltransferase [Candidatus Lokiarchaeota archaeon]